MGNEHELQSKASRLAKELAQEKKRLVEELQHLQAENEQLTPTTPTGTLDWYIKWGSTILGVIGVFLMSANFCMIGQICYIISAIGWVVVGSYWQDKAIMIGCSISSTASLMNLITKFVT